MTLPRAWTLEAMATMTQIAETFKMPMFEADPSTWPKQTRRMPVEIPNVGRNDLPRLFTDCGFARGAEVGVMRGEFSEVICKGTPGVKLYCVDPWHTYDRYNDFLDQQKLNKNYDETARRLAPYDATLVRKFSVDAAKDFEDGSLDFIYIDGNHEFSAVAADLFAWTPKIRSGGIISGHDYYRHAKPVSHCHVAECIDGWTEAWHISPYFALGRRAIHGTPGEVRDRPRSWMWVNV